MAKCRGCGKPINFIETVNGQKMPVEVSGTTIITREGEVVSGFEQHWVNCPASDKFRRKKPKSNPQLSLNIED